MKLTFSSGPNPYMALSLINSLELYNTIFTDPRSSDCQPVPTENWSLAYSQLQEFTASRTSSGHTISSVLLRNPEDLFIAWMLVCFVPRARESPKPSSKLTTKRPNSPASIAAKEGIKADNKMCKIVEDAVTNLKDVVTLKDSAARNEKVPTSPLKRNSNTIGRDTQGQAIRGWGSHWRSIVIFALLTEISEAASPKAQQATLDAYAIWLKELQLLNLLNVDSLRPIVNGNEISKALGGGRGGPWMKKAMDIAMDWQLRNPEQNDPTGGIEEVVDRKRELGFT